MMMRNDKMQVIWRR